MRIPRKKIYEEIIKWYDRDCIPTISIGELIDLRDNIVKLLINSKKE